MLADSLRTDRHAFRRLSNDEPVIVQLREWSRMADELQQERARLASRMREQLWRYYPQMLELADDLAADWFLDLWNQAPTPAKAVRLRETTIERFVKAHRLRRWPAPEVLRILKQKPLSVAPGVVEAASDHIRTLTVRIRLINQQLKAAHRKLDELCAQLIPSEENEPGQQCEQRDVVILRSMPGLGRIILAVLLPTGQARGLKAHEMRAADPPVHYLVGTPKRRLTRLEKHLVAQPWQEARPGVQVKLLSQQGELYVLAQSRDRLAKERAMRRRQLKRLWARLKQISTMQLTREELLMKLGAARGQSPSAWRLVTIEIAADSATFSYRLDRNKLRQTRSREGRYLLRTNLVEEDPAKLWSHYLLLVAVEEAFKNLKGDLAIRPIFHQIEVRIEAHVFIAFLAYCLHVTLARRLHALAPGLTPRSVLEKFAAVQMIDVHLPTTDGRELLLTRYTEPQPELNVLLQKLKLEAARPTATQNHRQRARATDPAVVPTFGGPLEQYQILRSLKVLESAKLG